MCFINNKCWGFAAENNIVTKAPYEYSWMINQTLQEVKPFFIKEKAIVAEVKA